MWTDCTLELLLLALSGILLLMLHMQLSKQFMIPPSLVLSPVSSLESGQCLTESWEWGNEWGANTERGDRVYEVWEGGRVAGYQETGDWIHRTHIATHEGHLPQSSHLLTTKIFYARVDQIYTKLFFPLYVVSSNWSIRAKCALSTALSGLRIELYI